MTKKESLDTERRIFDIYSGILVNYLEFRPGPGASPVCDLDCPEYGTLREKYALDQLAGRGSAFQRAKRLLHHFAPRLTHLSDYDNHVPCDALSLLEYSYERPDQGINCLNKAKVLAECCLAVGIHARRVGIMPYSPYDCDNHVVTEIYDPGPGKWIMLDPSTDGYFVDESGAPLSILEIRERFARRQFAAFVTSTERKNDLRKLWDRHMELNTYFCKNLFWLSVDRYNGFGDQKERFLFIPDGYDLERNQIACLEYRLDLLRRQAPSPEDRRRLEQQFQDALNKLQTEPPKPCHDAAALTAPPQGL